MSKLRFRRIVLKCSRELLSGPGKSGIDYERVSELSSEIVAAKNLGAELGLVIGGGNILRGNPNSKGGMERVSADYMGMLATVINALALQNGLEKEGLDTRVMTAITMEQLAEPYIRRRAVRHLEKGRIVIFAGGTGNPYFTTDSASALRALEIKANLILKGTRVDGVYSADPEKDPNAEKYEKLSFDEAIEKNLRIMDQTAFTLCKENNMPIYVFNMNEKGNLKRVLSGNNIGTLVS